ncbi:MAG TPA: hypothetical protein VHW01_10465 [Polyangiaceae bacterium]|jgi:hypothetical protein|nr:hypothetical protein [Polyangiaceae bacterium]
MSRRIKLLLLLGPLLLTLAALLDTPFHRLWQGQLTEIFTSAPLPVLSPASFWDGRFQQALEAWLEQELSLKAVMVRTDNTLNLAVFGDISGHTNIPIVLGKRNALFELNYINNRNGVSDEKGDRPGRTAYSLEQSVHRVARAARAFKLLGIDFMVLFYPSKASAWSERVPSRYKLPGGAAKARAGYQELLTALQAEHVPVIDGAAEFARLARENPEIPLYNSGGTHWTNASSCQISKLIVAHMPLSNPRGATLECRLGPLAAAALVDTDLAQLINVWDNSRFLDPIPALTPALSEPLPAGPVDALVAGSSFSGHLIDELRQAGVFGDVNRFFYYRHSRQIDWKHELAVRRVVVLEQWQWSYFTVNSMDFLDDISREPRFAKALREAR